MTVSFQIGRLPAIGRGAGRRRSHRCAPDRWGARSAVHVVARTRRRRRARDRGTTRTRGVECTLSLASRLYQLHAVGVLVRKYGGRPRRGSRRSPRSRARALPPFQAPARPPVPAYCIGQPEERRVSAS